MAEEKAITQGTLIKIALVIGAGYYFWKKKKENDARLNALSRQQYQDDGAGGGGGGLSGGGGGGGGFATPVIAGNNPNGDGESTEINVNVTPDDGADNGEPLDTQPQLEEEALDLEDLVLSDGGGGVSTGGSTGGGVSTGGSTGGGVSTGGSTGSGVSTGGGSVGLPPVQNALPPQNFLDFDGDFDYMEGRRGNKAMDFRMQDSWAKTDFDGEL
tara:strand:+ start:5462 stop:6103 length:642 start_codon:yes stop_codon:yes gene_type:complete